MLVIIPLRPAIKRVNSALLVRLFPTRAMLCASRVDMAGERAGPSFLGDWTMYNMPFDADCEDSTLPTPGAIRRLLESVALEENLESADCDLWDPALYTDNVEDPGF